MVNYKKTIRKVKKTYKKVNSTLNKVNKNKYVRGASKLYELGQKVAMLTSLVNVEKKRFDMTTPSPLSFAQFAGGASGGLCINVSPNPAEGITGNTRNGLSFKIVSACLDLYFNQQSAAINGIKIKWYLIVKPDNGVDTSNGTAYTQFLEVNPFSGVTDFHSSRDPEYFTAYRVIKQGITQLTPDALVGVTSYSQKKIPLKLNYHQRFNTDASLLTTKNKFFLIFTADTGEMNVALTGAQVQYNMRWYFTDN